MCYYSLVVQKSVPIPNLPCYTDVLSGNGEDKPALISPLLPFVPNFGCRPFNSDSCSRDLTDYDGCRILIAIYESAARFLLVPMCGSALGNCPDDFSPAHLSANHHQEFSRAEPYRHQRLGDGIHPSRHHGGLRHQPVCGIYQWRVCCL